MKTFLKIIGVLALLVIALVSYVMFGYQKKFEETPYPEITISKDSAVLAHGKYIVYGPGHCATCHTANGQQAEVDAGKELPLIGGFELTLPIGVMRTANLTPDEKTGIGKRTDKELARLLRYGVKHNGEVILPLMPFTEMSEYDLTAVISYLRAQPPVEHEVKPSEYNFMGKVVKTFMLKPVENPVKPLEFIQRDTGAEYGKYLATCVANCYGCHTDRNLKTGEFTGKAFAGGLMFDPTPESMGQGFVTPNLTPDKETSMLGVWSEEAFIGRMKAGRVHMGSPMPWGPFSRMDDNDLKAIYRYLKTVEPVNKKIEKTVYEKGEEMPKP